MLETPGQYELAADLPGVAAADVGVTVCAGVVELSGERSRKPAPPGGVYKRLERSVRGAERGCPRWLDPLTPAPGPPPPPPNQYGTLKRRFKLPPDGDADGVTASLEHGVLHIMVPRKPAPGGAEPPRRVSVRDREGRGWLA